MTRLASTHSVVASGSRTRYRLPSTPMTTSGPSPGATEEQVAQLRTAYGLDQPLYVQYLSWLSRIYATQLAVRQPDESECRRDTHNPERSRAGRDHAQRPAREKLGASASCLDRR